MLSRCMVSGGLRTPFLFQGQSCETCGIRMHLPCVAKYFQSNSEPHCPHCNDYWPHEIPGWYPQGSCGAAGLWPGRPPPVEAATALSGPRQTRLSPAVLGVSPAPSHWAPSSLVGWEGCHSEELGTWDRSLARRCSCGRELLPGVQPALPPSAPIFSVCRNLRPREGQGGHRLQAQQKVLTVQAALAGSLLPPPAPYGEEATALASPVDLPLMSRAEIKCTAASICLEPCGGFVSWPFPFLGAH